MSINIEFGFRINDNFGLDDYENLFKDVSGKSESVDRTEFNKWKICYRELENDFSLGYVEKGQNYFHHNVNIFANSQIMWRDDKNAYLEFIKSIKNIYALLKVGGFGRLENEEEKEAELFGEEYKKFKIWSVAILTPKEVEDIGRRKVLEAPAELVEELEDGAVFIMIHKEKFSSNYEERKKLREYLDVN